jgi:asparagine synthase (glutamine-hydrolysing)
MRNAMAGMLPEKVRWRRGKANLSMNFRLGLFQRDSALLRQHLTGGLLRSSGYVNNSLIDSLYQSEWQQAADRVPKTSASDAVRLWRGASLSLWMERNHVETSAALMPVTI